MNNTIDFKTAKTIDTMSKKIDHIDDAVTGFFSFMHTAIPTSRTLSTKKSLQTVMKPSSGSVKISWDVAILRLNKRTTLLESSMKQKSNPISTVATNTLHQRKVAVTKMVTAKKQVEPVNELLPKMASLEIPLFGRKNSPKA